MPFTAMFRPRAVTRPRMSLEVKPALSWHATVLSVKDIPAGALVGYGGMFRARTPMRIAVLAAGYADGIPHRLRNRGSVIVNGKFRPIVGAVSMDLTTIDVTQVPSSQPATRSRCSEPKAMSHRRATNRQMGRNHLL